MQSPVQFENIEEMRSQQGIEDVELRRGIRHLAVGNVVRITLLPSTHGAAAETLPVRITSIRGSTFRGKLMADPSAPGASALHAGSPVTFSTEHIHSLLHMQPPHEQ